MFNVLDFSLFGDYYFSTADFFRELGGFIIVLVIILILIIPIVHLVFKKIFWDRIKKITNCTESMERKLFKIDDQLTRLNNQIENSNIYLKTISNNVENKKDIQ